MMPELTYEARYQAYCAYCLLVGSPMREFDWWKQYADYQDTSKARHLAEFEELVA
jgi:hypothetical protein